MKRLVLQVAVSHIRHHGEELRVVRVDRPPRHFAVGASRHYYDIHVDRTGAVCLAAAWALAKHSPRSLVHVPIRTNRPPPDSPEPAPTLDLVLLHASAQFRVSDWKSVRARSRAGLPQRIELGTIHQEFPSTDEADFGPTSRPSYPHHLRYATAAETLFITGSVPAFEREGALLRAFVENFDGSIAGGYHHCAELWPTLWRPGHRRRIGPAGLHVIRETGWALSPA